MYRTFSIKNFRCFNELTAEGLGRINLIAGKNNIGKTALLEALWVHSAPGDPTRILRLDSVRGLGPVDPESSINNLFLSFDSNSVIELCARGDWGDEPRRLVISAHENNLIQHSLDGFGDDQLDTQRFIPQKQIVMEYFDESGEKATSKGWLVERADNPRYWDIASERDKRRRPQPPQAIFLLARSRVGRNEDAGRYSQLEIRGQQDGVLQILQEVEPGLKRLAVVSAGQTPAVYADIGLGRLIPVQLMGDGISRILSLALAIATAPGGMVLVDEIENGIHHSVMGKVWRAIAAFASSYDVQLFATTHSYECIGAAYRAFDEDEEDELRLFRIQRNRDGKYQTVKFDRERIGNAFEFRLGFI